MTTKRYQLVFDGTIAEGYTVDEVKGNLVTSFPQLDAKKIESLFGGQSIVIRKEVDQQTAMKFKSAFEKAGAVLKVEAFKNSISPATQNLLDRSLSPSPSRETRKTVVVRKCYNHPGRDATGACKYCSRSLCSECSLKKLDYVCCKKSDDCLEYQEKRDGSTLPPSLEKAGNKEYTHLYKEQKEDVKMIKCKGCGRHIPDQMYCKFCGKINWHSMRFELIGGFTLAFVGMALIGSGDKGLRMLGFLMGFIVFAILNRALRVLLSSKSDRIDPTTSPLKKDKGLSRKGQKARVGERSLTKNEWRSKYRKERIKKGK